MEEKAAQQALVDLAIDSAKENKHHTSVVRNMILLVAQVRL